MYSKLPNLIIGFHGCNKKTYEKVIINNKPLEPSLNTYDWLGNGNPLKHRDWYGYL